MYDGNREPEEVWEGTGGLHVFVLARNESEAILDGVEMMRAHWGKNEHR